MDKYILLGLLGATFIIVLWQIYKSIRAYLNVRKEYNYYENLKEINKRIKDIPDDINGILEYSREKSKEFGFNHDNVRRSPVLKRKGETFRTARQKEKAKLTDRKYAKAIKRIVPLKTMYENRDLKNVTLRVYVESMYGTKVIIRDNTAIKEIDLGGLYDIPGHFVLINIDRIKEKIKVNYILLDN